MVKPLSGSISAKNDLDHCVAEIFVLDTKRNSDLYFRGLAKATTSYMHCTMVGRDDAGKARRMRLCIFTAAVVPVP